ncbi:hypothetical protein L208DRAFT_1308595, partial [Tricholoma matsutake]
MNIEVLRHFFDHPVLRTTTITQITTYIHLAAQLKREIQLPQPLDADGPDCTPSVLPRAIAVFLSRSIGVPCEYMEYIWDVLKNQVWASLSMPSTPEDLALFKEHGWELGLTFFSLYPPSECCTNPHC